MNRRNRPSFGRGITLCVVRSAVKFDGFTALGLLIVAGLVISAWIFSRPPANHGDLSNTIGSASAAAVLDGATEAAAGPVSKPQPLTKEEAQAVMTAIKEQPENPIVRIQTTEGPILARIRLWTRPRKRLITLSISSTNPFMTASSFIA